MIFKISMVERAIGIPAKDWPGRCYEIAVAIIDSKIIIGEACYGLYLGEISNKSIFARSPITHHGWIESFDYIIDPTRWVFECVEPYIYTCQAPDKDYDFGGNKTRMLLIGSCPQDPPKKGEKTYSPPPYLKPLFTRLICEQDGYSMRQMHWIANLPIEVYGDQVHKFYYWLINVPKLGALIPYDNRKRVMEKRKYETRTN